MKQPSENAPGVYPETVDRAADRGQSRADDKQGEEARAREIGGPRGAEPTRFGDWEKNGRCIDF